LKRTLVFVFSALLLCLILIVASPFVLIQFGSPGMATASRALLHAAVGYSDAAPMDGGTDLTVAEGYRVDVYASGLGNIRFLAITSGGDLFVSRPRTGEVLRLAADHNGDGLPDAQEVVLAGLTRPHGLALRENHLYVAESNAIGRVALDSDGRIQGDYQRLVSGFGDGGNHWTKTIAFGPDGWLYLSSGSTCNVCEESDPQRATIMRMQADGSGLEIYARGLRNSVGFDWTPWDQQLFATDNGRDLLGDNFPPCELNEVVKGGFYGWPYYNADQLDPDFGEKIPQGLPQNRPPAHNFPAHNAPLGIRFLRHQDGPYARSALVALHGSWNRSEPDGYKVVSLHWQQDGSIIQRDFLSDFLQADSLLGRPVDVVEAASGEIFISDDYSGRVYRVHRGEASRAAVNTRAERDQTDPLRDYSQRDRERLVAMGGSLYERYACAECHEGKGLRPLQGLAERYSAQSLMSFFITPTPPMPQLNLNEAQREALMVYLFAAEK